MKYIENIQKTIDYIEQNLKETIDIPTAIKESGYSVTHFYRIFQAFAGISVKDYIRNRRLSDAAIALRTSNTRLIEIAIEYGFQSQEVFTRAFVRLFFTTPGQYRKSQKSLTLYDKLNPRQKYMNLKGLSLEPIIILQKEFQLVGLPKTVRPGPSDISQLWNIFHHHKTSIETAINSDKLIGLCEYMPDLTDESEFTYVACQEVSSIERVPEGMTAIKIPQTKYAVFSHTGMMKELKVTYEKIYGVWLPLTDHQLAEADTLEIYSLTSSGNYTLDIYIPLLSGNA